MTKRRVMLELRREAPDREVSTDYIAGKTMASFAPAFGKVEIDNSFPAVALPGGLGDEAPLDIPGLAKSFALEQLPADEETYIVRGVVDDEDLPSLVASGETAGPVVGIFSDPPISPFITCGGSPPVGTDKDVEKLLCVPDLHARRMTGEGVYVAVVDTGINLKHLHAHGKTPDFDKPNSWVPRPGLIPGELPVGHGTMCAYDACIAAPKCTLLDIAVLQSTAPGGTVMEGLLSDAVRAYAHLRSFWRSLGKSKALVVSNSWGMFHPSWDYPIGHPGNYSDNPNHPFNRIVRTLEREGADVLFAAGNCGDECPDGRCGGVVNAIYGANSHPRVISVAGVDTNQDRVGYSTKGPGRLAKNKPDISGYTHFKGSEVYTVDGGTSAATPVVAGVVAAIRTRRPYVPTIPASWPEAVRAILYKTAIDRGRPGYDLEYGWGIVNGCKLAHVVLDDGGKGEEPKEIVGSGPTEEIGGEIAATPLPTEAATGNLFFRLSRDSAPGRNVHHIVGLPGGTRTISIWVTEWVQPNNSHAGGAYFYTNSVQLYEDGTKCRFVYDMDWGSHLPTGVQLIFGS